MKQNVMFGSGQTVQQSIFLRYMSVFVIALVLFLISTIAGFCQVTASKETKTTTDSIPVADALEKGLIKLEIICGENEVRLEIRKIGKEQGLKIIIPEGTTKIGFISGNKIKTGSFGARTTYSAKGNELNLFSSLRTNTLSGDGFCLNSKQETVVTFEKDKDDASVSLKGNLSLNIPFGYSGFFLAGLSGVIIDGTISIEPNNAKDEEKIVITYGNMKLRK